MKLNTAKKLTAGALALSMMFAMATPAFAATSDKTYENMSTVTITKNYKLTNEGTVSPAEEFKFTINPDSVTDAAAGITKDNMPVPTIGTVSYIAGDAGKTGEMSKKVTINLPDYTSVGVYTYIIKETAGNTAGVTYYGKDIVLKVTVIEQNGKIRVAAVHTEDPVDGKYDTEKGEGSRKKDDFDNIYSAGDLNVKKVVEGNLGDKSKKFDFTVVFTNNTGKEIKSTIAATVAGRDATEFEGENKFDVKWDANKQYTYHFSLAHDETATFANLPYGVTYTVSESSYDGYKTTTAYSENSGEQNKIDTASETLTVTNTKTGEVDTGVILDNAPYMLMLTVVAAGAMTLVIKKRREEE